MAFEQINDGSLRELALFAGSGGGILGGTLCGFRTVCAVEIDPYARGVLLARQDDGCLPPFPIWDDVRTFDGRPWRGRVDIVSGGFPCQDISVAGKGAGINGARSGLWRQFARIIREVGPRYVLVENSPALLVRGIDVVMGDLASMGYDARWGVLGAEDAIWHSGDPVADHERERIWVCASSNAYGSRKLQSEGCQQDERRRVGDVVQAIPDAHSPQREGVQCTKRIGAQHADTRRRGWWEAEPDVGRVADGVAARMDRLRCIGNGQVSAVVQLAWETLSK